MSESEDSGVDVELPVSSDSNSNIQEQINTLEEEVAELGRTNERLRDELLDATAATNRYRQKLERLGNETEKLQEPPLFVGTVQEITDEGIVVEPSGNAVEVVTSVTDKMREELQPNDRVTLTDTNSIVEILDSDTDMRAKVMQVDQSPDTTYEQIGGLEDQIQEVVEAVEIPLVNPDQFAEVGIEPPSGVLLHGPPGTGKTMLARAVASSTDATFIRLAGSELVQKFVGEGAKLVRDLFEMAEENSPAIIFIDEIDAIGTKRGQSKTSADAEVQRTLMQLLSSMDGFDDTGEVRIIGATNRFDMLDDALLRPGRFDRIIEVPKPTEDGRKSIFEVHTQPMNVDESVNLDELAKMTEGCSGADINAICTEAGMYAIRGGRTTVTHQDFVDAHEKISMDEDDTSSNELGRSFQ